MSLSGPHVLSLPGFPISPFHFLTSARPSSVLLFLGSYWVRLSVPISEPWLFPSWPAGTTLPSHTNSTWQRKRAPEETCHRRQGPGVATLVPTVTPGFPGTACHTWVGRQDTSEAETEALGKDREGCGFLELILKGSSFPRGSGTVQGRASGSEFLYQSSWLGSLDSFQRSGDRFFEMSCEWVWMCVSTVQWIR